jgi:hypothetical protein
MPLRDQGRDIDRDSVPKEASSSNHALGGRFLQRKLDEKMKRKAKTSSSTNDRHFGSTSPEGLTDSTTGTTTSSATSRATGRRCVDTDPADRPEVVLPSTKRSRTGRMSDHADTVTLKTPRSTRPSLDHQQVNEDNSVMLDDESTLRPGVVATSGVYNDSMGSSPRLIDTLLVGDRTEQQPPNTDQIGNRSNLPAVVTADTALCGGTIPDVEQGGPIQAQPIDEEEYRQRIENEYRDRLLRQAAVYVFPGFVRAAEKKDSLSGSGFCSMTRRTVWIAIILAISLAWLPE